MSQPHIRPVVIGVFRRDRDILVFEAHDPVRDLTYCRPLGGGIEFGEHSRTALVREMREELGAEVADVRYLGTLENVFTNMGKPGHEIVLVYAATFVDPAQYARDDFTITDAGDQVRVRWLPLDRFGGEDAPALYPDGLYTLLLHDWAAGEAAER